MKNISSSVNQSLLISPKASWSFMAILGSLMAITSLSTDIYLPAMPQMQNELQGNVELTITGFLVGFAVAQLIWGIISDRIGRRTPLFIGMALFVIGSVGCALSQNSNQMVFWRVFQAIGACTGPMLARAIIRDRYTQIKAARMLSSLVIIMAIAPIIGPLMGGQIVRFSSWHNIFWLLAIIGCVMFLAIFYLPETHQVTGAPKPPIAHFFINYLILLRNKRFMRYVLCITFFYVAAYGFIVGSPFVYITYYGVDAQHYGWLFAVNIVGLIGLSFINRRLVNHFKIDTLLRIATVIAMCAMLILSILFYANLGNIYWIVIMVFIFFSTNGIIAACATAAALDNVGEVAGSAYALIGSLQYGSGIISSILLANLSDGTPWTMIWIMTMFIVMSTVMVVLPLKQSEQNR